MNTKRRGRPRLIRELAPDLIADYQARRITQQKIGAKIGATTWQVRQELHRLGITRHPCWASAIASVVARDAQVTAVYLRTGSYVAAAAELGLTKQRVHQIVCRHRQRPN